MPILSGKVKWACVQKPNTKFEHEYSVVVVLDKEKAKELSAEGYNVKQDKEGDTIIKVKKKALKADGTPNRKPNVVDAQKKPFEDLIGNGSYCNVQYTPYPWVYAGSSGVQAQLVGVQVVDLVAFTTDEFDVIEGSDPADAPVADSAPVDDDDDFDDDIPF